MPAVRTPPRQPAAFSPFTLALAALVLVALIAYSPAISAPLIFDDTTAIDNNASITRLWPPTAPLLPPPESPVAGRPIANLTLALNYAVNRVLGVDQSRDPGGPNKTVSYHLVAIALHIATGLLLLGIVRRTMRSARFADRWAADADTVALIAAAIWLLHPLQSEAVNYLTQRTELVASLCFVGTLYCSIRAWDAIGTQRKRWYGAAITACFLGMGAKEMMVSAPFMVLLYDRAFRLNGWTDLRGEEMRSRRRFYGGLFATLLLLIALIATTSRSSAGSGSGMSPLAYLNTQGWAIPHYLQLFFWPAKLTLDYGYVAAQSGSGVPGLLLLTLLAAATIFAWTRVNRWGWLGFCGAWFFLLLAPSSSVIPIATEVAAERRVYLAIAAVIVAIVIGLASIVRWRPSRTLTLAVAAAVVTVVAVFTWRRSTEYQAPAIIWGQVTSNHPDNARGWNNLGAIFANQPVPREGEAESFYRHALDLDSTYAPALYNLGVSAFAHRQFDQAESLFRRAATHNPDDEPSLVQLGGLLMLRGNAAGALPHLEHAVELAPRDPGALTALGVVKAAMGQTGEAADFYRRALLVDPGNDAARQGLARLKPGGT